MFTIQSMPLVQLKLLHIFLFPFIHTLKYVRWLFLDLNFLQWTYCYSQMMMEYMTRLAELPWKVNLAVIQINALFVRKSAIT